jgi:hypothetical protein
MEEERDDIIMMEDEEGNQVPMVAVEMLDYEEKTYVLMQNTDEKDEDSYIFLYEEQEGDEAILTPVEDDALLDKLFELFLEKLDIEEETEDK